MCRTRQSERQAAESLTPAPQEQPMSFTQLLGLEDEGPLGFPSMAPMPPAPMGQSAAPVDQFALPWKRLVAPNGAAILPNEPGQVRNLSPLHLPL